MRGGNLVARLGGDEFVVALENIATREEVTVLVEKISSEIAMPFVLGENTINVSASIGIARYPEDGENAEALIKHADAAMYHVKKDGWNVPCQPADDARKNGMEEPV